MAKPAPTGPNAAEERHLGEFRRGMLAKEIEDKAFALNAGQYTQPIRTKQGFIILQVAQHTLGGDASFKQVEPQVEEALFMERMQPALRAVPDQAARRGLCRNQAGSGGYRRQRKRNAPDL